MSLDLPFSEYYLGSELEKNEKSGSLAKGKRRRRDTDTYVCWSLFSQEPRPALQRGKVLCFLGPPSSNRKKWKSFKLNKEYVKAC